MSNVIYVNPIGRFRLQGWAGGYRILDRGEIICTFHGPNIDLAWATLCRLREDARRPPPEPQDTVRTMFTASVDDLIAAQSMEPTTL